jgi:hypothetical protein
MAFSMSASVKPRADRSRSTPPPLGLRKSNDPSSRENPRLPSPTSSIPPAKTYPNSRRARSESVEGPCRSGPRSETAWPPRAAVRPTGRWVDWSSTASVPAQLAPRPLGRPARALRVGPHILRGKFATERETLRTLSARRARPAPRKPKRPSRRRRRPRSLAERDESSTSTSSDADPTRRFRLFQLWNGRAIARPPDGVGVRPNWLRKKTRRGPAASYGAGALP